MRAANRWKLVFKFLRFTFSSGVFLAFIFLILFKSFRSTINLVGNSSIKCNISEIINYNLIESIRFDNCSGTVFNPTSNLECRFFSWVNLCARLKTIHINWAHTRKFTQIQNISIPTKSQNQISTQTISHGNHRMIQQTTDTVYHIVIRDGFLFLIYLTSQQRNSLK